MSSEPSSNPPDTYTNPVYPHACPDPFVLKHEGEYWCYFTGTRPDGGAVGILHSPDLVRWEPVGVAMQRPDFGPLYWGPEVSVFDGRFYLYYSTGNEETMEIRVALADHPAGPFHDAGVRLTAEPFAIDPHVFVDDDDQMYLFYATDYLDYERVGTGIAMDRMLDPLTLAGQPRPVARARYDWQIFDPRRESKGGVRWHTVEGPFVLKHNGRYYLMFSGGNWQNESYGVSYAVSARLDGVEEWQQERDGVTSFPLLRSHPQEGIIGPGHNSVTAGPDGSELFCVYHRWQPETNERVLAIDRLGWEGDELVVYGPTSAPQPAPRRVPKRA